jgi:hypothetical protein
MKNLDLSKLSREEKLRLLAIAEEKKRRLLDARESYAPNAGQLPVHMSDKKVRAVFTGNGGGKTAMAVNEALWAVTGFSPVTKRHTKVPARVIVVLDKPEKVTDVWLPELKKWFPITEQMLHKRGKPYVSQITFDNASELIFMFHDQEPMSFESIEADFFIFDEPPPRHVYIALRRGGRKKGTVARYLLIGTPIAAAWLRKEVYEPWVRGERTDTECFKFHTSVNEQNLAEGYIESFSSVLSEKEKRVRLSGEFFDLEGLALAHLFARDTHVVNDMKWAANWPVVIAIDPHPRKQHCALMLGVTPDDDLVVLKELRSRAIPSQFARDLRNWYQGYRVAEIVCDSLGSSELTGGEGNLSFIQVLNDNGVRVRATRYDEKQDEAWIQLIQEVLALPLEPDNFGLRKPRLRVLSQCIGTINDIESVEWQKYRNMDEFKPKLAIEAKDMLACLKYALAARPHFNKNRERVLRSKGPVSWNNKERSRAHKRS